MPWHRHTGLVGMLIVGLGFSGLWQHAWAWGDLAHTRRAKIFELACLLEVMPLPSSYFGLSSAL